MSSRRTMTSLTPAFNLLVDSIMIWLCLILSMVVTIEGLDQKLQLLHQWRQVDFEYPSPRARDEAIRSGAFIPGNPIPIDIDFWQHGKAKQLFVTIPRFKDGVPASLVTVSGRHGGDSPLLTPYPDWSWHTEGKCSGITSAFRTQIDKCGRLWVIDSGMIDLFKAPRRRLCQPQILAFNLASDRSAGKYQIPSNVLQEGSVLATIAVDCTRDKCSDAFVYVADVTGFAIVVLDTRTNKFWKVQSNTMYPYPVQGIFKSNGVEFDLMDGVLGMALTPPEKGERLLFYHPFASIREAFVQTSILKNQSIFSSGFNTSPRKFHLSEEARQSQAASEVFDKQGNLFFAPVGENTLMCWNVETPYKRKNIHPLLRDDTNLQFVTGIKVAENEHGEEDLYIMTDRFQIAMVGQYDPKQINFRIMKARIHDLVKGSGCKSEKNHNNIQFPMSNNPSSYSSYFG